MAPRVMPAVDLAMVVMAALCGWVSAQAGCAPMMVNLTPCFGFISGNMSAPPATCCTQLDSLVQTQMGCLCTFLATGSPFRIPVNQTQALALPGACNIKAGQCNAAAAATPPVSSPVAPGPASPETPSTPSSAPSPSGTSPAIMPVTPPIPNTPAGGSKTVPGGSVVGSSTRLTTYPLFFCLLIAITSYASSVVGC